MESFYFGRQNFLLCLVLGEIFNKFVRIRFLTFICVQIHLFPPILGIFQRLIQYDVSPQFLQCMKPFFFSEVYIVNLLTLKLYFGS